MPETLEDWLDLSKECYDTSTSFVDANYRGQWEKNLRHFQSKHHADSKFSHPAYKYRNKLFRPKTRAAVRNTEAAGMAAFFSNQDVLSIDAQNPSDPLQQLSAEINYELMQYRLTKTIPWFLTCIGGLQDAQVIGCVASYNHWRYQEKSYSEKTVIEYEDGSIEEATARLTISRSVMMPANFPLRSFTMRQPILFSDIMAAAVLTVES